jgi:glycosyltransferase involved in cell wall biosynthesis
LQVGFVGRPYPGKGIEMLIEAARRMRSIDVHIIGASRKEMDWLGSPIPSNVYFHGFRPHAELKGIYKRFDVAAAPYGAKVLNASSQESAAITSPLKLIEYMAAGLPIVVSDLPGVRDMIAARDVAILIPPGDADALVSALKRLKDPAVRQRMGAAARKEYLERHTAEARAYKVLAPIQEA